MHAAVKWQTQTLKKFSALQALSTNCLDLANNVLKEASHLCLYPFNFCDPLFTQTQTGSLALLYCYLMKLHRSADQASQGAGAEVPDNDNAIKLITARKNMAP